MEGFHVCNEFLRLDQHNITLDQVFWFSFHGCRFNLDEVLFWWMPNLLLHLCRWTWKSRQCWPRLTGWWDGDQFMLATCMHYRWMDTLKKIWPSYSWFYVLRMYKSVCDLCTQICMHMYVSIYIYTMHAWCPCAIVNGIWILGMVNFKSGKVEYI